MIRNCPHCGKGIDVFDEECPSCGKPSKPGVLLSLAAIIHGHRQLLLLIAGLVVIWIVLSKLFNH